MPLLDRMQQDVKDAMKSGDARRRDALRLVISELKRAAIDGGGALDEAEEIAIVQRCVKQRREASEAFAKGGRSESAQAEDAEAEILSEYLPAQLDDRELEDAVQEAIAATGAASPKDMGKVMGRIMGKYAGRIDGQRAREAVQAALNP